MCALREYVVSTADEYRENMEPVSAAITAFYDEWAEDIDRGIQAFAQASDNIARRMITKEKNPDIEKKKQEELDSDKNKIILNMETVHALGGAVDMVILAPVMAVDGKAVFKIVAHLGLGAFSDHAVMGQKHTHLVGIGVCLGFFQPLVDGRRCFFHINICDFISFNNFYFMCCCSV